MMYSMFLYFKYFRQYEVIKISSQQEDTVVIQDRLEKITQAHTLAPRDRNVPSNIEVSEVIEIKDDDETHDESKFTKKRVEHLEQH